MKKQDKPDSQNSFKDEMFREKRIKLLVSNSKTFAEKSFYETIFHSCS